MRLAFLDLPDDRVDLIALARWSAGVEIVLVAHPDPDALALKIAEVLQIPRSTEPLDLFGLKPDQIALPSMETPSAAALSRAGMSGPTFITLDDLAASLGATTGPGRSGVGAGYGAGRGSDHPPPDAGGGASVKGHRARVRAKDSWGADALESFFDAAGRLGRIQEALDLTEDHRRLLREILSLAVEQTGSDSGSIMLVDEDEGELRIAFAEGLSADTVRTTRQKLGMGIAGAVALQGKPLVIHERVENPRQGDERERSRISAAMCAPISSGGRIIGVLNVSSDRPERKYDTADLDRLTGVAIQISGILDRLARTERRDADAAEFRARRVLEEVVAREGLTQEQRLSLAAARLASLLEAQAVQVYLADPDKARFRVIPSGSDQHGTLPIGAGLVGTVYRSGKPVFLASRLASVDRDASAANLILIPLAGSRPLGVVGIEGLARVAHDLEEQTRRVARLGRFLAKLLEGERDSSVARQGALKARLAELAPRMMIPHNLESLLAEGVAAMRYLFPRGLVSIRLRSSGDEVLSRVECDGTDGERDALGVLDQEVSALVLDYGIESSSASGADADHRERGGPEYLVVPIQCSGRTVGSLGVCVPSSGPEGALLASAELEAIRQLALYVSLALERSQPAPSKPHQLEDPLTGLLGGSGLEARLLEEVKRAERYHDRFLLTLCSVAAYDRLLKLHGPEWADDLVREFAQVLTRNVRDVDVVARVGGGRFAILSPETERNGGVLLPRLEQLLTGLSAVRSLPDPDVVRLIGRQYAFPEDVPTGDELLALIRSNYALP